jgi:hypothetical protein
VIFYNIYITKFKVLIKGPILVIRLGEILIVTSRQIRFRFLQRDWTLAPLPQVSIFVILIVNRSNDFCIVPTNKTTFDHTRGFLLSIFDSSIEPRRYFLLFYLFSFSFSPFLRESYRDHEKIIILYLMFKELHRLKRFHEVREYYLLSVHYEL